MNKNLMTFGIAAAILIVGITLRCTIETASGPTPYTVFQGQAGSPTPNSIGNGVKVFMLPGNVVMNDVGRWVTITPESNDTTLYMKGIITAYDRTSGNLTVNVTEFNGSGSYNTWTVVRGKTAAEVLDSVKQAYVNLSFGMFLHFNMSTFDRCCCPQCYTVSGEWGKGKETAPAKLFRPTQLNCGQWADAAKAAGCTYMVLTAKHHDGFCLWPTKYTSYSVANATCTTDVVRQFVDSARSRGMRVGFYYSIRDLSNGIALEFIKGQMIELLTDYGNDILCLWFDGWGWDAGYRKVPYDTIRNCVKSIQPNCLLIENNHEFTTTHSELLEWEMPIDGPPPLNNIRPAEGNEPIRYSTAFKEQCWFWHPVGNCDLMPAQMIVSRLKANNAGNAAYLLDLTPDTLGLIPQCQVDRMSEVGQLLGATH
jgi:alpha-L-fucosidase